MFKNTTLVESLTPWKELTMCRCQEFESLLDAPTRWLPGQVLSINVSTC